MASLKLGPLPKVETVRVPITLPKALKEALDLYAQEHGRLYEPVEAAALIPHMIEAFLRSDRAFMKQHAKAMRPTDGRPTALRTSDSESAQDRNDRHETS